MPIIDNELLAEVPHVQSETTTFSVGHHIKQILQNNLSELGDSTWMVSASDVHQFNSFFKKSLLYRRI